MTEEPIIEESPKRDFYYVFADEAAAVTALQPFYYQPLVQGRDSDNQLVFEEVTDSDGITSTVPVMENDGDAYLVMHSHNHSFDIVGLIHEPTGNMLTDAEGIEYPEMAPIPGWHINLRIRGDYMRDEAETIDAADGVSPVTPHRTWL